jgi:hypothetical protein
MANITLVNGELPEKKVWVKPNYNNPGWIKNRRHVGFFKMEGCHDTFVVAMSRQGNVKNPFTNDEKKKIEEIYGYEENTLSVYNKKSPVHEISVRLSKDPILLDLANPEDFIKYKILLTNSELICPSVREVKNKQTYKYYIEDQDEVNQITKTATSKIQKAWKAFGKMEEDRTKLTSFLKTFNLVIGKPIPKIDNNTKLDFLQSQVADIVQNKTDQFITIIENEDYDTLLLVASALDAGVIKREGTKHSLASGEKIGNNLKETVDFLKRPVNQDTVFLIESQLK